MNLIAKQLSAPRAALKKRFRISKTLAHLLALAIVCLASCTTTEPKPARPAPVFTESWQTNFSEFVVAASRRLNNETTNAVFGGKDIRWTLPFLEPASSAEGARAGIRFDLSSVENQFPQGPTGKLFHITFLSGDAEWRTILPGTIVTFEGVIDCVVKRIPPDPKRPNVVLSIASIGGAMPQNPVWLGLGISKNLYIGEGANVFVVRCRKVEPPQ